MCVKPDIYWWRAETEVPSVTGWLVVVAGEFHLLANTVTVTASAFPVPGDGSIYIGDDYFVIPVPKIDRAMAATGALILSGHAEHHIIRALL